MKTAIYYLRVSTDKQEYERQRTEILKYANNNNLEILEGFEEKQSGTKKAKNRTEFSRLLEYVENNKVDNVIFWEVSRIGRKNLDILQQIDNFTEKGINTYILSNNLNTLDVNGKKDPNVNIIMNMLAAFAENELETLSKRQISGIRNNVKNGGGGVGVNKAYGYTIINKKLVVDEEQKEVVQEIYKLYLKGLGCTKIARILRTKEVPTKWEILKKQNPNWKYKESKWTDVQVNNILHNPIYKGNRKHKGEIYKVEPIISVEDWEKVQVLLDTKNHKKGINTKFNNPLKDKIICGNCGRQYTLIKRSNGKDNAYRCGSKSLKFEETTCNNPSINYDKLLQFIYQTTKENYAQSEVNLKKENIKIEIEEIENEIVEIEKGINKIDSALYNLVYNFTLSKITQQIFDKVNEDHNKELKTLQVEKAEKENKKVELKRMLASIEKYGNENILKNIEYENWLTIAKDIILKVIIYEVPNKEEFSKMSNVKNDVPVLVNVFTVYGINFGIIFRYNKKPFIMAKEIKTDKALEKKFRVILNLNN